MSTIENMTGVSIRCNWLYPSAQRLDFFPAHGKLTKQNRVAMVYGKNGSGKSTIAQGFREYAGSTSPRTVDLSPTVNGTPIHIGPDSSPEKFLVFDEEYVDQRVKVKDQGLEAIVLFGDQVTLDDQIEQITENIQGLKEQEARQEEEYAKHIDASDATSPKFWLTKIIRELQADGGWAEKKGIDINGGRQKANVNEREVDRIGLLQPVLHEQQTKAEFDCQYVLYRNASMQGQEIKQPIKQHMIIGNLEEASIKLLEKSIDKPQTSARENELLELFGIRVISDARVFLSDTTKSKCPTCLQDVLEEYRSETLLLIENILNRDVMTFQSELRGLLQKTIDKDDYSVYKELEQEAYCNVQSCIDAFNTAVEKHNNAIQAKIDNPFEAMMYDTSIDLTAACDVLNQALDVLEAELIAFNDAVIGRERLRNDLLKLNDEVAHYVINDDYLRLIAQRAAREQVEGQLVLLGEQIAELEQQKLKLDAQRKSLKIAVDDINNSLAYIFFSRERLEVVLNSDEQLYHLRSNGKKVDPNKVSCGERNALALCYFFTEIAKETDVRAIYADEMFLVIDDPVSSFDMENRIGIISFLRWKLGQILLGCPTTKVLMMTHDISVLYDMEKVLKEIAKECTEANKSAKYCLLELGCSGIEPFQAKKHNEYKRLLEIIYDYALNGTNETELVIGNIMRRVLEAFSTFLYRKGIADISYNKVILAEIDETIRAYFQNLMYRLVLHGESHYEEHIQGFQGMEFFSHLSQGEKQRTARDIICFMYVLNRSHILSHLSQSAESDIVGWIANIRPPTLAQGEPTLVR